MVYNRVGPKVLVAEGQVAQHDLLAQVLKLVDVPQIIVGQVQRPQVHQGGDTAARECLDPVTLSMREETLRRQ